MKNKFIPIKDAMKKEGKVNIRGWVYRERKSNKFIFLVLRDSTDIIQCVIKKDKVPEELWKAAEKILIETSVKLEGSIKSDKRAPTGFEIEVKNLEIVSYAEDFPMGEGQSHEYLLDMRHLWLRSRKLTSVLKVRSTVFNAVHEYFRKLGYYEFHSPIIIPGGAEEGPTLFELKYFDRQMFLTQTWQLYAEAAIFALEKIYTVAPSFRAEKSKTSRHLTEYWHAEVEVAWFGLDEIIDLAEGLVKHVVKRVLKENKEELKILKRDVKKLEPAAKKGFPRITYTKALKLLKEKKNFTVAWGKDLRTVEEEKLMELFDTPVFVTHYPKEVMAFYKPRDPRDPKTALCFDLLGPEANGELIGGSERDTDIKNLTESLKKVGEDVEDYHYYLDTRRYGSVPHAGFGMGVERLVKWVCGLDNIKDAIGFPRTRTRTSP